MEEPESISIAEARSLLGRALESIIRGDVRAIDLFAEDVEGDSPNMCVRSRAELMNQLTDRAGALSKVEFTVDRVERGARGFVVSWHASGDHTGEMLLNEDEFFEPTGVRIEISATTHVEFYGRRVRAFRTTYDGPDLFEQLRGRPAPSGP